MRLVFFFALIFFLNSSKSLPISTTSELTSVTVPLIIWVDISFSFSGDFGATAAGAIVAIERMRVNERMEVGIFIVQTNT